MMKQYCRYCAHAMDYNGEETDFLCQAKAPCGNDGTGRFYPAQKAKCTNNCPHFCFNEIDVFGGFLPDGTFKTYQPRAPRTSPEACGQLRLEERHE